MSHAQSPCLCCRQTELLYFFNFLSQTTARICFKFCVDVTLVDPYQVCLNQCVTYMLMELWVILRNFLIILKNSLV